jgi:ubiquinone/menaquinone biosynthesis C-methylase UbiE
VDAYNDLEIRIVREMLAPLLTNEIRYLDVAVGTGRILRALEVRVKSSIGLDTSWNMLNLAREKSERSCFVIGDAEDLPFKEKTFDLITVFQLLVNIPPETRGGVLQGCQRVLKPGGVLVASIHFNTLSLRGFVAMLLNLVRARKLGHLSYFKVKAELQQAGFSIRGLRSLRFWPIYRFPEYQQRIGLLRLDHWFGRWRFLNRFGGNLIIMGQSDPV